jgi:hypothetical protein
MKSSPSYPVWLTAFMLLGPFLMVSSAAFRSLSYVWVTQIAGAAMIVSALFYLAKRLHEQTEEVLALKERLKEKS